jgi:hypothetical protein
MHQPNDHTGKGLLQLAGRLATDRDTLDLVEVRRTARLLKTIDSTPGHIGTCPICGDLMEFVPEQTAERENNVGPHPAFWECECGHTIEVEPADEPDRMPEGRTDL